jgi:hypothetical protein
MAGRSCRRSVPPSTLWPAAPREPATHAIAVLTVISRGGQGDAPGRVGVHLNAALSNTLVRKEGEVTAELDVEMVRTVIDVRYGVRADFEMGLEIPFLYTYGGILDDFIFDVERLLHKPRNIRRNQVSGRLT